MPVSPPIRLKRIFIGFGKKLNQIRQMHAFLLLNLVGTGLWPDSRELFLRGIVTILSGGVFMTRQSV
jgi:hypothetical protein